MFTQLGKAALTLLTARLDMNYTLITGASAGIGEVFAKELAHAGNNLILVARRKEKLEALAQELIAQYGVAVEILVVDLMSTESSSVIVKHIESSNWVIDGLINNAGFGDRGAFVDLPLDRQLQMIQLNVTTLVELTHRLLPCMLTQQSPYIINVASTAAFQAGPNMAIYYATKAFVLSFSEALHEELSGKGIAVSALCPRSEEHTSELQSH